MVVGKERLHNVRQDSKRSPNQNNIIVTYQGTNFNRKIASEFEGLFSYLSPEMPLFQALSGISLV